MVRSIETMSNRYPSEDKQTLTTEVSNDIKTALVAIQTFKQAIEAMGNQPKLFRCNKCKNLGTPGNGAAFGMGFISYFVTMLVIPLILSKSFNCVDKSSMPCFNDKATLALVKEIIAYIGANQNEPWAKALIDSMGPYKYAFSDIKLFLSNLTVFCTIPTAVGPVLNPMPLNLRVPSSISSGIPGAAAGVVTLGALLGNLGTVLIQSWGWRKPPISLHESKLLWSHLEKLNEFKSLRNELSPNDIELTSLEENVEEISLETVESAIEDGKELLWRQGSTYVHNMAYLVAWVALGFAFWKLTEYARGIPESLAGDYSYNTFENRFSADRNCDPASLNITYRSNETYYPIQGVQEALRNTTIGYPDQSFYNSMDRSFTAAVLTGLAAPLISVVLGILGAIVKRSSSKETVQKEVE